MISNFYILLFLALFISLNVNADEFNREKVTQWQDPSTPLQTRTHCISDLSPQFWQDKKQTCHSWATDLRTKQIAVYAKTLIIEHFPRQAYLKAKTAADTCASQAIAKAKELLKALPNTEASNNVAQVYSNASSVFKYCITSEFNQQEDMGIKPTFFKFIFDIESFWSNWSNE